MLPLILSILITAFAVTNLIQKKGKIIRYNIHVALSLLKLIIFVLSFITLIAISFFSTFIASEHITQNQIEIYEKENSEILNGFTQILINYKHNNSASEYPEEAKTNVIYLINTIPEFSDSYLIEEKTHTYVENELKIKELKLYNNNHSIYKWLLYFGK